MHKGLQRRVPDKSKPCLDYSSAIQRGQAMAMDPQSPDGYASVAGIGAITAHSVRLMYLKRRRSACLPFWWLAPLAPIVSY